MQLVFSITLIWFKVKYLSITLMGAHEDIISWKMQFSTQKRRSLNIFVLNASFSRWMHNAPKFRYRLFPWIIHEMTPGYLHCHINFIYISERMKAKDHVLLFYYQPSESRDWRKLFIPSGSEAIGPLHSKSFNLTGLAPATRYAALVLARNRSGWSKPSKVLRFATEGARKFNNNFYCQIFISLGSSDIIINFFHLNSSTQRAL